MQMVILALEVSVQYQQLMATGMEGEKVVEAGMVAEVLLIMETVAEDQVTLKMVSLGLQ